MLIVAPLGEDLAQFGSRWLRASNVDPATRVLCPNRRLVTFLEDAWGSSSGMMPRCMPLSSFVEEELWCAEPGSHLATPLEGTRLLWEVCSSQRAEGSFLRLDQGFWSSYPFLLEMLRVLEEILWQDADRCPEFLGLATWVDMGSYHPRYGAFLASLPDLMRGMEKLCQNRALYPPAFALRRLMNLWSVQGIPGRSVVGLGCHHLVPSQEEMFRVLQAQERLVSWIVQADAGALARGSYPWSGMRNSLRRMGLGLPEVPDESGDPWADLDERVHICIGGGLEEEMAQVHSLLASSMAAGGVPHARRWGVMLPDPASLMPFLQGVLARFSEQEAPVFNLTMGYPFSRTPLCHWLDLLMRLICGPGEGGVWMVRDILAWQNHPLTLRLAGERETARRCFRSMELWASRENPVALSTEEWLERLAEGLEPEDAPWLDGPALVQALNLPPRATIRDWLAWLGDWLERIRQLSRDTLLEGAVWVAARDALDALACMDAAGDEYLNPALMRRFLQVFWKGVSVPFYGTPLQGVQVMGPLEYEGLAMEHLIVCDLLEGVLPKGRVYDPYLPRDVRQHLGMGEVDPDEEEALRFLPLLHRCQRVTLMLPSSGASTSAKPSRFLERVRVEMIRRGLDPEGSTSTVAVPPPERRTERCRVWPVKGSDMRALSLSPSGMACYLECPAQYHYRYVRGLSPFRGEVDPLESRHFGTRVHRFLQEVHQEGQMRKSWTRAEIMAALLRAEGNPGGGDLAAPGLLRVRLWLAGGRLEQFLSHDRPPEGVQRRVEVERQLACLLTLDGGRTLRLEGRADRLDWHDGRLFRVVDYKTGGMPVTRSARSLADLALLGLPDLEGRELCQALAGYRRALPHLQILLYLLMAGETFHVDPASLQASYACPVQGRGTWIHWPDSEEDRVSVAGALEVLRGLVGEAATDIMTRAVWWPVEDPRICVYCPYQGICRPCLN